MNSLSTMYTFALIVLCSITYIQLISAEHCGPKEVDIDCAPLERCQPSCKNPNGTVCPRVCDMRSCICREGFVRDDNNPTQCIEQTQCERVTSTTKRPSRCGPNEVAIGCALLQRCQPSCEHRQGTVCPMVCSRNPCVCKEGYIRDPKNNWACIKEEQCEESFTKDTPTCGENEESSDCANPCQPSCEEPNREPCETVRCSKGCVCSEGYRRATNDIKSRCIKCDK